MTLVDGGLPGFRSAARRVPALTWTDRLDIAAVLLTHAHSDDVGMVEGVRNDAPAPGPRARTADADMARTGRSDKRDG